DTLKPAYVVSVDTINCFKPRATAMLESIEQNLNIIWKDSNGNKVFTGNPLKVISGGRYTVEVTQPRNHCVSIQNYTIVVDTLPPTIQVNDFTLLCNQDSIQLAANSSCPDGRYLWKKSSNGMLFEGPNPYVRDTGLYSLTVICKSLCNSNVTLNVQRIDSFPRLSFQVEKLNCKNDSVQIKLSSGVIDTIYQWKKGPNFISNKRSPFVSLPGDYQLNLKNTYGCSIDTIISVEIDTSAPVFNMLQLDTFRCDKKFVQIATNSIDTNLFILSWSTPDGFITLDNKNTITVSKGGNYILSVEDSNNGCKTNHAILIDEKINVINSLDILVQDVTCNNKSDGEVKILNVNGGEAEYSYSLDNSSFGKDSLFSNLGPSSYRIHVKDKYSCLYDTIFTINDKSPYTLEIIRDTVIQFGQIVPLVINTNMTNIFSSTWSPSTDLSCSDCINPFASPKVATIYELILSDSLGCEVKDAVLIELLADINIFVPSVFSPNGDGVNDQFGFYSEAGLELIISFEVFDRWGERVFQKNNFKPVDNAQLGWDGKFNGETLNPGVYVYKITAKTRLGDEIIRFGDITLLR
ncbi:MAG: gliding motility-associated C-terminal domain-containing protein, partial [Saprospiraceae bacterium]